MNNNNNKLNPLSLENQLCFPLYVCSKEIIKMYSPYLSPLGLTYTMYITLMVLWEKDNILVKELGERIYLDSGTLTPLLKKMEEKNFIKRNRSGKDQREVYITLTKEGKSLKQKCMDIPKKMMCSNILTEKEALSLMKILKQMMKRMDD